MTKIIIIALILLVVIFVASSYNGLIIKRNRVIKAWNQIDVQLKKRFDLIPNLVETVKGYIDQETTALKAVVKARNYYISASKPEEMMEANIMMTGALRRLFASVECYPDLKANAGYIELQGEFSGFEEIISDSRQLYNDAVMMYNTAIQAVPVNIIANLFGFFEEPYFKADDSERHNVKVVF